MNYEGFQSGWWKYSLFPALGKLKLLYSNPFRWFISKPQVVFHMLTLISTLMDPWEIPLQISRILSVCSFVIQILYLMKSSYLVFPGLLDLSSASGSLLSSIWVSPFHSVTWNFPQISKLRAVLGFTSFVFPISTVSVFCCLMPNILKSIVLFILFRCFS